jgi:hypothetical protein
LLSNSFRLIINKEFCWIIRKCAAGGLWMVNGEGLENIQIRNKNKIKIIFWKSFLYESVLTLHTLHTLHTY